MFVVTNERASSFTERPPTRLCRENLVNDMCTYHYLRVRPQKMLFVVIRRTLCKQMLRVYYAGGRGGVMTMYT